MTQTVTSGSPFAALPAKVDLPGLDRRIIGWWRANNVFAQRYWIDLEHHPPTASADRSDHELHLGSPPAHHHWAG
jgi:hypothetical protein